MLAVAWTLPISAHVSTHLPGEMVGDNVTFLWNFWWMRKTLAEGISFFHTTYLFAPVGADLTLHTHTALPAFVGATVLRALSNTAALNVTIIGSIALSGIGAYALAWRLVRERTAAVIAGLIFACSPFVAAHLMGHFNLMTAWMVPWFALSSLEAVRRGSVQWAIAAGVLLAGTAYGDYYLLVYEVVFAVCVYLGYTRRWALSARVVKVDHNRLLIGVAAVIAIDVAVLAVTLFTPGFTWHIGSATVSVHEPFNPTQVLSVLAIVAACAYARPSLRTAVDTELLPRARHAVFVLAATVAVLVAPLARNAVYLILNGDYVSQPYFWRNAPAGIDVMTLVMGNPFHGLLGAWVREEYVRLGIDALESTAWLGIVPTAMAIYATRCCLDRFEVRFWLAVGGVFFVWALGSHVTIAGRTTGLLTPSVVRQFIPVISNARMPGRAMVMVYLSIAVIAAFAVAHYRSRHAALWIPILAASLVIAEQFAAPLPITAITCPPIYGTLRDRPESGALAELPLGMGDGFGNVTPADNRMMLACQTVHGRPLVGGFIARLSPGVLAAYRADPLLAAWLRLSGATDLDDADPTPEVAARSLRGDHIAFVLIDQQASSKPLIAFVGRLPLTRIASDERRVLYAVLK